MSAPPPQRPRASFQPRFTLSLLYLALLFFVYSLVLIAPELADVLRPAGPEDEAAVKAAAAEAARQVSGPRLPWAMGLAIATLFLGAKVGFLPGLRPPGPR
ncbi:MAG: hypothetical protein QF890_10740 [Myxococcota bacterium]|jgi:ABC-type transport system involved in cytochrome c biogenesis permease subunit|nr:hypothetical protein [Myxococcota bacterium]MDP7433036.1 hypothetical protein [Myxococcota bacterium]